MTASGEDDFEKWLNGSEGFSIRSERLMEDAATGNFELLRNWLRAAYEIGRLRGRFEARYSVIHNI